MPFEIVAVAGGRRQTSFVAFCVPFMIITCVKYPSGSAQESAHMCGFWEFLENVLGDGDGGAGGLPLPARLTGAEPLAAVANHSGLIVHVFDCSVVDAQTEGVEDVRHGADTTVDLSPVCR